MLFLFSIGYGAFQTQINVSVTGKVKEGSRVLKVRDETAFWSNDFRENIVSVTFLDSVNVPNDAAYSWDVSSDGKGGVKAYVMINQEDYTKYDLFIGAKDGVIANEDSSGLFRNFENVRTIYFNDNFDTSNVISMSTMFNNCFNLERLDLSGFDTSRVTNMYCMIGGAGGNCTSPGCMGKLEEITFGEKFLTSNVENMEGMFVNLSNVKRLDLSNFDFGKVRTTNNMFSQNFSLEEILFGNMGSTSLLKNMYSMFYRCKKLESLNLCAFDTSGVTNMQNMFYETFSLTGVYVGDGWTMANADTTNMFSGSNISSVTTGQCS